jgi:hypothetical protein
MDDENRLASKYIALQINDETKKLLSKYSEVTPSYSDSEYTVVEARSIKNTSLAGGETVTYNIRLWMDESVTIEDDVMNKIFASKISVVASPGEYPLLATTIVSLASTDTTNLVYDDETADHNTRYIGANPNNYLCFDKNCTNGKWRVIGVMNNMETESNGTQSLVKIIRAKSIGSNQWDSNYTNDWSTSSLNAYLIETWYPSNLTDYDSLLETVTWNLGGIKLDTIIASSFYKIERGTTVYGTKPTEWTGKVALMYPSDYGFASSGGSTTDRATCLATSLHSWGDSDLSDCKNNDYLYLKSSEWTLTPSNLDFYHVFDVYSNGRLGVNSYGHGSDSRDEVRPVGYLVSNTKILSGNGSSETPWIIGA